MAHDLLLPLSLSRYVLDAPSTVTQSKSSVTCGINRLPNDQKHIFVVFLITVIARAHDVSPKERTPSYLGRSGATRESVHKLAPQCDSKFTEGEGTVDITVSNDTHGKITASIADTGCGISPERLASLFRPFQTTKEKDGYMALPYPFYSRSSRRSDPDRKPIKRRHQGRS